MPHCSGVQKPWFASGRIEVDRGGVQDVAKSGREISAADHLVSMQRLLVSMDGVKEDVIRQEAARSM